MSRIGLALIVVLALTGGVYGEEGEGSGPAVGDKAPAFSLQGSDGKQHALDDHAGKRPMVIAWFPKAFTSG
jgi:peroxiredoxin Q/BCP